MSGQDTLNNLESMHCRHRTQALPEEALDGYLQQCPGWQIRQGQLLKQFEFSSYPETLAFANAAAWIAHREDHHPDIHIGYRQCTLAFATHSADGLTENDFICAAKINGL